MANNIAIPIIPNFANSISDYLNIRQFWIDPDGVDPEKNTNPDPLEFEISANDVLLTNDLIPAWLPGNGLLRLPLPIFLDPDSRLEFRTPRRTGERLSGYDPLAIGRRYPNETMATQQLGSISKEKFQELKRLKSIPYIFVWRFDTADVYSETDLTTIRTLNLTKAQRLPVSKIFTPYLSYGFCLGTEGPTEELPWQSLGLSGSFNLLDNTDRNVTYNDCNINSFFPNYGLGYRWATAENFVYELTIDASLANPYYESESESARLVVYFILVGALFSEMELANAYIRYNNFSNLPTR